MPAKVGFSVPVRHLFGVLAREASSRRASNLRDCKSTLVCGLLPFLKNFHFVCVCSEGWKISAHSFVLVSGKEDQSAC